MPKISVIIPTRNDNFGGGLVATATASIITMSKTFDEVIIVDFGSQEPIHNLLINTITEVKKNIRFIIVPKQWVVSKLGDDSIFADVLARNIGLRRASNDILVSSNIDIIPGPLKYFDFGSFNEDIFYTSNKFMIDRNTVHSMKAQGTSWEDIQEYLFNTKDSYPRQGAHGGDPWSKIGGCGDFQLAHKKIWFHDTVRGFEETLIYKEHSDSNVQKKVIEYAHYDVLPAPFFYVFHQSHLDIRVHSRFNDWYSTLHGFQQTTNPETWGFITETFEEYIL